MYYKELVNTTKITRDIISKNVKKGSRVLDCTLGNGNDTIYLAELVGPTGKVYGFDIQKAALDISLEKLIKKNLSDRVELIKDGHENIDLYIKDNLDLIIYNLGYLPGGNKTITTDKKTTIISIEKALKLLNFNGIILITCYTGHVGGLDEKNEVEKFLEKLDQKEYNVLKYDFINQINSPPILFGVEKNNYRR